MEEKKSIKTSLEPVTFEETKTKLDHKEENINDNKTNNYIIAEFETKIDNQTIRIINSFEEFRRDYIFTFDTKEKYNEKEIKDNCEIRIKFYKAIIKLELNAFYYFLI